MAAADAATPPPPPLGVPTEVWRSRDLAIILQVHAEQHWMAPNYQQILHDAGHREVGCVYRERDGYARITDVIRKVPQLAPELSVSPCKAWADPPIRSHRIGLGVEVNADTNVAEIAVDVIKRFEEHMTDRGRIPLAEIVIFHLTITNDVRVAHPLGSTRSPAQPPETMDVYMQVDYATAWE